MQEEQGKLRTETIGSDEDNPSYSICRGHVTAEVFNEAFKAEGWNGGDSESWELTHEHWISLKNGVWKKSELGVEGAVAVTVGHW